MKSILKVIGFVALASLMAGCSSYPWSSSRSTTVGAEQYSSDAMITSKVKAKYARDMYLKAADVSVSTKQGVVTLVGKLPSMQMKKRAIEIAMNTKGVRAVDAQNVMVPGHKKHSMRKHGKAMAKETAKVSSTAAPSAPIAPSASNNASSNAASASAPTTTSQD